MVPSVTTKVEKVLSLSQTTNLIYSKLKEFTDNNFDFDENGRKLSKWIENTEEKSRFCSLQVISPFPTVFLKDLYCRHVKIRICLGKG